MKQEKMTKFVRTEDADRKWVIVDAKDQVLGRIAAKIARLIRGKEKANFTPNSDTGDFVIVINANQVTMTGKRELQKTYFHHSMYPGGVSVRKFADVVIKDPEFVIQHAVKGMLPKNRLGKQLIKKLKVYAGETHPHEAQKPELLSL